MCQSCRASNVPSFLEIATGLFAIAIFVAVILLATKIGDKPEIIVESIAAPVCPKLNPCAKTDCHRVDLRTFT